MGPGVARDIFFYPVPRDPHSALTLPFRVCRKSAASLSPVATYSHGRPTLPTHCIPPPARTRLLRAHSRAVAAGWMKCTGTKKLAVRMAPDGNDFPESLVPPLVPPPAGPPGTAGRRRAGRVAFAVPRVPPSPLSRLTIDFLARVATIVPLCVFALLAGRARVCFFRALS